MVSRRKFLKDTAAGATSIAATSLTGATGLVLGGCATGLHRDNATAAPPPTNDSNWLKKLSQPLPKKDMDYEPEVEGKLPEGLSGTLYRNGPGVFTRNGKGKRSIVDGDGQIREITIENGKVRFRTRIVETAKYNAEEEAGKFLYPTWTTPAPGLFGNIPCVPEHSQAGVTAVVKNGVLYAFDEVGLPWGLDPATLNTIGEMNPDAGNSATKGLSFKAHTKTDGATGNWILTGQRGHVNPELHAMVIDPTGKKLRHVTHPNPRETAYFHDFFWADPYVVFHLHPGELPTLPLSMLVGGRPFSETLEWKPEKGGQLFVVDTTGGKPPVSMDVPACWMWHTLNAYKAGNTIVADFVGFDTPDHFIGKDPAFHAVMEGREGTAKSPGTLRRFTIDLAAKKAELETVADGRYEFPTVAPGQVGQRHQYGYVASKTGDDGIFHNGVARVDVQSGAKTSFHFGNKHYVGEPIYAPNPAYPPNDETHGWIIAEVLDGDKGKSFMAVFEAARLQDGPIAKVQLSHHLPISFHGSWLQTDMGALASNQNSAASRLASNQKNAASR